VKKPPSTVDATAPPKEIDELTRGMAEALRFIGYRSKEYL
jgi:hypothetical protein